ncbi:uncharacterized protein LOC126979121 [Leptidea sinapis]|uniref:uncharacterized protein LOC126979121 n=1 Tax=Leptidea sinapis TaxID=189913 RepID=UPI0021C42846|nr:uncharacterized protein LOC126979121 [Leptidea sinapis]
MFTRNGRCEGDIERIATAGNCVNGTLHDFMKGQTMSKEARRTVHNRVLDTTFMYGTASWVWQKKHKSRIYAVEIYSLCEVRLIDRIPNAVIRARSFERSSCLVFLYNPLCCKALCANTRCRWTLDSGTTIHHGASNRRSGVAATVFEVICLSPCTRQALFSIEPLRTESFKALRFVIDHVSKHLRALESLGQPIDQWDALIIYMVSVKLDIHTSRKWEEYKGNLNELPSLSEFFSFLRSRADVLETSYSTNRSEKVIDKPKSITQSRSFVVSHDKKDNKRGCIVCNDEHPLHACSKFKNMSIDDRYNEVTKLKLCKNCLRSGHNAYQCQLKGLCLTCKKKHNTLIHKPTLSYAELQPTTSSSLPVSLTLSSSAGQVLLCTAVVELIVNDNIYQARALLDMGSQSSFVTENLKKNLGLSIDDSSSVNVYGINNVGCRIYKKCEIKVKSRVMSFEINVKCLVVPQITGILPNSVINTELINIPNNIQLADPKYFSPADIDILLGADVYWEIVGSNIIKLGSNKPVLQESKLGWLVGGLLATKQLCEDDFKKNVCRLPNGRFSVHMPLKEGPEKALGDSYYIAKKCLESLERKFIKQPSLKEKYKEFINEYADLGHLTKINRPEFGYFMPHHAVIREKSETTKLRVVFNASSKTHTGKSLNDILMVGPVVQSDLISILLRFREHKYVLTGDIEKMFRQTEITPSQRHLQLILWCEDCNQPIDILRLNTVTYVTASAPFLSSRCLLQLANECDDESIARIIKSDFYADDLNTGADTVERLQHIYKNVVEVLDSAC